MKITNMNPIPTLYKELKKEGFKASWKHPVFPLTLSDSGREKKSFYIVELPIPQIAPFNSAYASVSLKDDRIHCCFTFLFSKVFNDCMSNEDCIKAMKENEPIWLQAFHNYFGAVAEYFALEWEIEANGQEEDDEVCEMTFYLEGTFDIKSYPRIKSLMIEVRELGQV